MAEGDDKSVWNPPSSITELFSKTSGNKFAGINRPTAGARDEIAVPDGGAPIQLYSLATPNGIKVSILLEELSDVLEDFSYDAHVINRRLRQEMMNWLFWQMAGQGPMTGNFGHFFVYAPDDNCEARDYGVARYGMETQRLCDVLERHLADGDKTWIVGEQYSLADICIFPWFNQLRTGYPHKSGIKANEFLNIPQYKKLNAWAERILEREAVKRGITVCGWTSPNPKPWKG